VSPKIRIGRRSINLPRNRLVRVGIGLLLILFGVLGFLPVVGFWMIPLGLLVLSIDLAIVRRWRRRLEIWWAGRRRQRRRARSGGKANANSNSHAGD